MISTSSPAELSNQIAGARARVGRAAAKPGRLQPLVGVLLALFLVTQIGLWLFVIPNALRGGSDFRTLYTAGYMVRSGHALELYDYDAQKRFQDELAGRSQIAWPFLYPAYSAALFVPLSLLSYRSAYLAFLALNLALLAFSIRVLRPRLASLTALWRPLPYALFLCFLPIGAALGQGQVSIVLLALYSASLVALDRGSDFRAGLLVGLALIKFQIALPVAVLFLVWRRWRFLAGFAGAAAMAVAGSLWVVGLGGFVAYCRSLVSVSVELVTAAAQLRYAVFPATMPNLRGLVWAVVPEHVAALVATAVASLLVLVWAAKREASFPLAVVAALLVSYHLNTHDLTLLIVPAGLALDRAARSERWDAAAVLAALFFITPACLLLTAYRLMPLLALPLLAFLFVLGPTPAEGPACAGSKEVGFGRPAHAK